MSPSTIIEMIQTFGIAAIIMTLALYTIPEIWKRIDKLEKKNSAISSVVKQIFFAKMAVEIADLEEKDILTEEERGKLDTLYELYKNLGRELAGEIEDSSVEEILTELDKLYELHKNKS